MKYWMLWMSLLGKPRKSSRDFFLAVQAEYVQMQQLDSIADFEWTTLLGYPA
jgi:hypothetical protein